ncbi:MAG: copper-translocating P-type ATPase [Ignavibacteriales bacterium]|nr:MAG: copper-translocating P-type ATPase [Ignavibacteriales bacterium]
MTCASCVARVEKTLKGIDGLQDVNVNFGTEKVSFQMDNSRTKLTELADKLEEIGYKLKINEAKDSHSHNENELVDIESDYSKNLKKDLFVSLFFTIPVFLISMTMEFKWFHQVVPLSMDSINKILLILSTPVVFISGKRFYSIFWRNLIHKAADMNSLVAIGTGAAYIYSTVGTLFPQMFSSVGIASHVYFDSTVVIITLILLGRWLENRAKQKTNTAIKKLLNLKPKEALIKKNDLEVTIPVEDLQPGHIVIIKPGDKIPADGTILTGSSTIDESMLTGESIAVEKVIGSKVFGGTLNKNGYFEFQITDIGDNSVLGRIIKLVEEAQNTKAPIQQLADKVASVFVPAVIILAALTFISWFIFGGQNSFNHALVNFVAVLIIACPCALGLATPTAIMVGTGLGASKGILIKNGEALELIHKAKTIIFDKTGTITLGNPTVTDIVTYGINEDELLLIAASVENKSNHPVAQAITNYAKDKKLNLNDVESFRDLPGLGIQAVVDGKGVLSGNEKLLNEFSIHIDKYSKEIERLTGEGKSIVFIAVDGELKGILAVEDPVKENSVNAIKNLQEMKYDLVMLTGDNKNTAGAIAKRVGINKFNAEVLPDEKLKVVEGYQQSGNIVVMVGDGINDSPALAKADVGIAIGSGTDVAIETADAVLLNTDLNSVVKLIKLSSKTILTIKQNLFWAFIYNIIGIPLAALGLLNPMFAALAMSFSSVSVISNSLRLKRVKL